ncbi:hypothetical protein N431DRAFT_459975 [Stipitochalara longipes BDJ]|nr:hypothetical protein N431DRAFT_459975 [Stipitochalara longipes BDJ]
MYFSSVKAMLGLFSLLAFFTFGTAAPAPIDNTLNTTPLDTRQMSGNVFYGDACNPNTPLRHSFPDACWLTIAQTKNYDTFSQNGPPTTFVWESTLFLFDMACNIIGYLPNAGNLENGWVTLDSRLPYTIDIETVNNVPSFNYAGQHYSGNYQNGYVEQWTDDDSGNNEHNWRFLVFCGR